MKNPKGRGLLSYLFMFIFVCIGVACIFFAILMFSPGTEIFGLSYVNSNTNMTPIYAFGDDNVANYQDTSSNSVANTIVVKTGYFGVKFINTSEVPSFKIELKGTAKGFRKNGTIKKIGFKTSLSNKVFTIESVEPELDLGMSRAVDLIIYMPLSTSAASVRYNSEYKDVKIVTESGDVSISDTNDNYKFYNLSVETNSGKVNIGKNFTTSTGSLNVKAQTGNITVNSNISGTIGIDVKDKARIYVGETAGNLDIRANFTEANVKRVGGKLMYASYGGYINADYVGSINCTAEVESVAHLNIKYCEGDALISDAKDSDIKIDKVKGDVSISTTSGKVTIGELLSWANITTTSGKVYVTFNTQDSRISNISTDYGYVQANFVKASNVNINQQQKGGVDVNVANNLMFNFNYFTNRGIYIFGETTDEKTKTGEFVKLAFNNATSSSPTIQINNNQQTGKDGAYNGYINLKNDYEK